MCLTPDSSGANCLDVAISEVNYRKYGTSEDEKKEVREILMNVVRRALGYATYRRDDADWGTLHDGVKVEGLVEIPYSKEGELKSDVEAAEDDDEYEEDEADE